MGISNIVVSDGVTCLRMFIRVNICLLLHEQFWDMPWIRQSLSIFYEGVGANPDHSIRDFWWTVSLCVCVSFVSNSRPCVSLNICYLNAVCLSRSCTDEL